MPDGKDQRRLIVFGNFAAQLEPSAYFEFCVAIVIKSEGGASCLEVKICVKEEGVLIQNVATVTAL